MKAYLAAALLVPLSACAIIPDTPMANGDAAAQGTAVGIDQPVWAGDTIVTPLAVTEDSRCPMNARCVWAGKLTVSTRIAATHWTQTAPLTLGEPYTVMGRSYVLVSATPEKTTDREIPAREYRFVIERR
ncbi:hypothetical protein K3181_13945 [Qipengyuania sp. YG27]|uniref:Lipoprotein n=1 Tax=Qipengyuania mesophila TaxID=2867246 RepID=A0ABS7JY62_9SPHN|nr:hypothetical protein [Qipengyuania mesophila]MBX7502542.1 hypothetical protein [Qipengyuania mesophila]